jgi:hypothetical protein
VDGEQIAEYLGTGKPDGDEAGGLMGSDDRRTTVDSAT